MRKKQLIMENERLKNEVASYRGALDTWVTHSNEVERQLRVVTEGNANANKTIESLAKQLREAEVVLRSHVLSIDSLNSQLAEARRQTTVALEENRKYDEALNSTKTVVTRHGSQEVSGFDEVIIRDSNLIFLFKAEIVAAFAPLEWTIASSPQ